MLLYILIILISMVLISTFNIIFGLENFNNSPCLVIGMVILAVVIEIIIDLIFAGIIHALPNKYFDPNKKFFCVSKKEQKFYERLNIRKWKDKVIELGALGGFRKNKIKDQNDANYIYQFLIESNKGIIIHIANIIFGFLIIICIPIKYALVISLPVAIVNLFLSTLPIFILRYNIPKLKIVLLRIEKKSSIEN